MSIDKVLYRAQATSQGGREGISKSSDGVLDLQLSTPKELGGGGGPGTNPEQLFAAGYSACFLGALKFVAGQSKVTLPQDLTVTGDVIFTGTPEGIGAAQGKYLAHGDVITTTIDILSLDRPTRGGPRN